MTELLPRRQRSKLQEQLIEMCSKQCAEAEKPHDTSSTKRMRCPRQVAELRSHAVRRNAMANDPVFAQLEKRLMDVIPQSVRACDMAETAYCLRVYYDSLDTHED